jgi:hypothetical protein
MIYGEFNAFSQPEIEKILSRARISLRSGGHFLAEVHTPEAVEKCGKAENSWYQAESGLFSDRPHICLVRNHWHADESAAEAEYYVIDAATTEVEYYRNTLKAYSPSEYRELMECAGYADVQIHPAWGKPAIGKNDQFLLLCGQKPAT